MSWYSIWLIENGIVTVFDRVNPSRVKVLTNMAQSAQTFSGLEWWIESNSLSNPAIDVMQSTKNWLAYNITSDLSRTMNRRVFLKRHMCSANVVIIVDVFVQHAMQMFFIENDHVIQTLAAKCPMHSLAKWICLSSQLHLMVPIHREHLRLFILFTHCMAKRFPW